MESNGWLEIAKAAGFRMADPRFEVHYLWGTWITADPVVKPRVHELAIREGEKRAERFANSDAEIFESGDWWNNTVDVLQAMTPQERRELQARVLQASAFLAKKH